MKETEAAFQLSFQVFSFIGKRFLNMYFNFKKLNLFNIRKKKRVLFKIDIQKEN